MLSRAAILFSIATVVVAHSGECHGSGCGAESDSTMLLQGKIKSDPVPAPKPFKVIDRVGKGPVPASVHKILNDFKNMAGEVTVHAQQPHISSHIKQLLKKTFPKTEKKQLKEATTKTKDHLKDAMHDFFPKILQHFKKAPPKTEVKHPVSEVKHHVMPAPPVKVVTRESQPAAVHKEATTKTKDQLKDAMHDTMNHLKEAFPKILQHFKKAKTEVKHPASEVHKPPFSAAKARAETAHDLKEAVHASQPHWLSNMKFPHQRAIDKQLKHIDKQLQHVGAPSDSTAQAPTGVSFKIPTFHIVFGHEAEATPVSYTAAAAEYLAMTLFVVIGCGCAMAVCNEPGWVLQVALTFGLAITALAYTVGHFSGGQINCAVTLGLVLAGKVTAAQGALNFIAQMLGSITGAFILTQIIPEEQDKTGGLGTNSVNEKLTKLNAFVGEFLMTFLLMFVVLETAINPETKANREMAAVAIGFAVFLAHSVLINIDGCSINPTRTFGPAFVRQLCYKNKAASSEDQWVFWAGPLLGAAGATLVSSLMR